MKHLIRKCPSCGAYTLAQKCPRCDFHTQDPNPPKYSPDDKYARYRIADRYLRSKELHRTCNENPLGV